MTQGYGRFHWYLRSSCSICFFVRPSSTCKSSVHYTLLTISSRIRSIVRLCDNNKCQSMAATKPADGAGANICPHPFAWPLHWLIPLHDAAFWDPRRIMAMFLCITRDKQNVGFLATTKRPIIVQLISQSLHQWTEPPSFWDKWWFDIVPKIPEQRFCQREHLLVLVCWYELSEWNWSPHRENSCTVPLQV